MINFFNDNEFKLRRDFNKASNIEDELARIRSEYYSLALYRPSNGTNNKLTSDAKHFFYLTFSNMREASKALRLMSERAVTHVANRHTIFEGEMKERVLDITQRLHLISQSLNVMAKEPSAANVEAVVKLTKKLNRDIDRSQVEMVNIIGRQHVSMHSSEMFLDFLQGLRDMANRYVAVAMMERALSQLVAGSKIDNTLQNAEFRSQVLGSTERTDSEEMILSPVEEEVEGAAASSAAPAPAAGGAEPAADSSAEPKETSATATTEQK